MNLLSRLREISISANNRHHSVQLIISDFDGVMTDNKVFTDVNGVESVCCSRSDGLALDYLRKSMIKFVVLSTEANPVVKARCLKLQVECIQATDDKERDVLDLAARLQVPLETIAYIGNDINDLSAMKLCGCRVCPSDAHPKVKAISTTILRSRGGEGVIREYVERLLLLMGAGL